MDHDLGTETPAMLAQSIDAMAAETDAALARITSTGSSSLKKSEKKSSAGSAPSGLPMPATSMSSPTILTADISIHSAEPECLIRSSRFNSWRIFLAAIHNKHEVAWRGAGDISWSILEYKIPYFVPTVLFKEHGGWHRALVQVGFDPEASERIMIVADDAHPALGYTDHERRNLLVGWLRHQIAHDIDAPDNV